jgi:L,D-transpeptidase catalytic domain/Putative peptidoglycan binding domain
MWYKFTMMRTCQRFAMAVAVFFLVTPMLALGQENVAMANIYVRLAGRIDDGLPLLVFSEPELPPGESIRSATLLRSTTDLGRRLDHHRFPVARLPVSLDQVSFTDTQAPDGVPLYYRLKLVSHSGTSFWSNVVEVQSPMPSVGYLSKPSFLVDKLNYVLLLLDGDNIVRSFPIALGANPENRKVHFDRASTPEGLYQISGLQPQATYYRALDLNYPNVQDQVRYGFFAASGQLPASRPHIGGEIQIHGEGISENWTWGCIALRNQDMDWLFARRELRVGFPVMIAGSELRPDDLMFLRDMSWVDLQVYAQRLSLRGYPTGADEKSLTRTVCRYQQDHRLPVTGVLDLKTVERLR